MKASVRPVSVLALVVVAAVIICWSAYAQRPAASRTVWEYKAVWSASEESLNSLGAQGWELVAVTGGGSMSERFYLKRAR